MKHYSTALALVVLASLALLTACAPVQPLTVAATSAAQSNTASSTITQTAPLTTTVAGKGQPGPVHCLVDFEATVRQGPSKGVALKGVFDFKVDETGTLYGKLLQENQSEILAAGQVIGRAIHLVFVVGKDQNVFGVGTAKTKINNDTCGLVLGGPLVGPAPGDAGDWLATIRGGNPSSTPACDISCGD
jgi:hypothetical protein